MNKGFLYSIKNTLRNPGAFASLFIVKYDFNGNVKWAKRASSFINGNLISKSIATDATGHIYVTGDFTGSIAVFDNDTLKNKVFGSHIFLAKYDSLGNVIWTKSINGNHDDNASSLVIDKYSNIYLTGTFESNILDFTDATLINPFINYGSATPFIAKIDSSGNTLWAKKGIMNKWSGVSKGQDVTIDTEGNSYLIGSFDCDSIYFDNFKLFSSRSFNNDIFIVKYDSFGNVIWAKSIKGNNYEAATSISSDNLGHISILGTSYSPYLIFDNDTLYNNSFGYKYLF